MKHQVIRTFSYHYRKKYGCTIGKLPVHLGVPCPNREKGGCIFCSPASFTPAYLNVSDDLPTQVVKGKKGLLGSRFKKYFVYFQQESCTAGDPGTLLSALQNLLDDKQCVGAILSTRPDCVEDTLLDFLASIVSSTGKEIVFELGIQTVHQRSLDFLNRNHTFGDFRETVSRIQQKACFEVGAHLLFGVPGEGIDEMLESVKTVCSLGVNALKMHHLLIVKDTLLHHLYTMGKVQVFTREEYQDVLLKILPYVPESVTIHRLWATAHPKMLIAPQWNCLTSTLSNSLRDHMAKQMVWQGKSV